MVEEQAGAGEQQGGGARRGEARSTRNEQGGGGKGMREGEEVYRSAGTASRTVSVSSILQDEDRSSPYSPQVQAAMQVSLLLVLSFSSALRSEDEEVGERTGQDRTGQ
eukprot:143262-Hanusia_phi.AAC.1